MASQIAKSVNCGGCCHTLLPATLFFLGLYPDQNQLFGQNCQGYDASMLEFELDACDLDILKKWRMPDSKFMSGGRENRKRALNGFKNLPFST